MLAGSQADGADFETLQRLVAGRHSCRAFLPTTIPESTIRQILCVAQRSASDCNTQPWRVTVVSGRALDRLREGMYERAASGTQVVADVPPIDRYFGVHLERRRECGWSLYEAVRIERGDREASLLQALENFRFFGAPHLLLVSSPAPLGARGIFDCGGYIASLMLAAHALGVATVAQASVAGRTDVIREHLSIPLDQWIICGIAMGWPNADHPANQFRTTRAPVDDVATFVS